MRDINWVKIGLINFSIVALLGVLMRYKIGFEFPFLDQKHLQHAHSHFAFAGWVSHLLYVLLFDVLKSRFSLAQNKKYNILMGVNLLSAYGMLISFTWGGYWWLSILFSTLSVIVSYFFALLYIQDLRQHQINSPGKRWFTAALCFNLLSSVGTFFLGYLMASHTVNMSKYLGAVYYYLHFQYNGWFFFACMGLFMQKMSILTGNERIDQPIFRLFLWTLIPAYFLSMLWANLPLWLYTIVVVAAIIQCIAWAQCTRIIYNHRKILYRSFGKFGSFLFSLVFIAGTIKFLLQLFSTIPTISKLSFGFRPIVIAYLHLVLLAFISLFILVHLYTNDYLGHSRKIVWALILISAGIFLNECMLMIQGIASFGYILIPFVNEILFAIALLLFISIGMLSIIGRPDVSKT
ncbi:MAG: hypothetical protein JNJ58_12305 [Chitinophagaceae bacterium]|nr:hypothetical protein [Chitinophagaceae bacterium]